jgi:hypothetical protein
MLAGNNNEQSDSQPQPYSKTPTQANFGRISVKESRSGPRTVAQAISGDLQQSLLPPHSTLHSQFSKKVDYFHTSLHMPRHKTYLNIHSDAGTAQSANSTAICSLPSILR